MTDQTTDHKQETSGKTFADLGVADELVAALEDQGITEPFPIQEMTIPLALSGADIIGQARTGTGKTFAFGLPLLQRIEPGSGKVQALVITPTRELAVQVSDDIEVAGKRLNVKVLTVYGGTPMEPQIEALRKGQVDIAVGTPGRLLDHMRRRNLILDDVRVLVLDEADRMLDMGFLPDVEQLMSACGEDRQTSLFSATMPSEIVALGRRFMASPTFIRAESEEPQVGPDTEQHFLVTHRLDKPRVLARILQSPKVELATVFVSTKRMADRLVDELRSLGVNATPIHGDLRQASRERNLESFREGKSAVLVATEVAARGLDIERVTHVVNYDCPDDEKMYLHRIGRTGRAGAAGVAVTFAGHDEIEKMNVIRKRLDAVDNPVHEVFSTSEVLTELFDLPERTPWDRFGTDEDVKDRKATGRTDRTSEKRKEDAGRSRSGSASQRSAGNGSRDAGRSRAEPSGDRTSGGRAERPDRQESPKDPQRQSDRGTSRRRDGSDDSTDTSAARVRVRRREDPTTTEESSGDRRGRSGSKGSGRSRSRGGGRTDERSGRGSGGNGRSAKDSSRESGGGGGDTSGSRDRERSEAGTGSKGRDRGARNGGGSRQSGRGGGGQRSGGGRSGGRDQQRSGAQHEEQKAAAEAAPEEVTLTDPGADARGRGRPTLSRRVQVDHIP